MVVSHPTRRTGMIAPTVVLPWASKLSSTSCQTARTLRVAQMLATGVPTVVALTDQSDVTSEAERILSTDNAKHVDRLGSTVAPLSTNGQDIVSQSVNGNAIQVRLEGLAVSSLGRHAHKADGAEADRSEASDGADAMLAASTRRQAEAHTGSQTEINEGIAKALTSAAPLDGKGMIPKEAEEVENLRQLHAELLALFSAKPGDQSKLELPGLNQYGEDDLQEVIMQPQQAAQGSLIEPVSAQYLRYDEQGNLLIDTAHIKDLKITPDWNYIFPSEEPDVLDDGPVNTVGAIMWQRWAHHKLSGLRQPAAVCMEDATQLPRDLELFCRRYVRIRDKLNSKREPLSVITKNNMRYYVMQAEPEANLRLAWPVLLEYRRNRVHEAYEEMMADALRKPLALDTAEMLVTRRMRQAAAMAVRSKAEHPRFFKSKDFMEFVMAKIGNHEL